MDPDAPKVAALHFGYADGLRAVAVAYVFLYHLVFVTPELGHHVRVADLLMAFDPVVMFFILSGFLLSGPYLKAYLRDGTDFPLTSGYAIARSLRTFPPYYVAIVTISLYLWFIHQPPTVLDFVSHALFFSNFSAATSQTLAGPLWTLGVDIQIYIALPIVAWCFFATTRRMAVDRRIVLLFSALGLVCVGCIAYRYYVLTVIKPVTWEEQIVYLHQLPGSAYIVAAGIGIRAFLETMTADLRKRLAGSFWLILGSAVCFFRPVAWAFDVHYDQILNVRIGSLEIGKAFASLEDLIAAVACDMVFLALAVAPTNPLTRLLSGRVFAFASAMSFSFYLYHMTVIDAFAGTHPHPSWTLCFRVTLLSLAVLLPICYVIYTFVETPFLKIKARLKRSKRPHVVDWSDVEKAGASVVDAQLFPGTSERV